MPENGIRAGQLPGTRSAAEGEDQALADGAGSRSGHSAELGSGDGGDLALPVRQTGGQLLRAVRRRAKLSGQGDAHAAVETAQQTYPARAGRSSEAGTAAEPGAGSDPSEGDGEKQQQEPGDAGRGPQDSSLAAGRGSREPRVHPGRAAGWRSRVKTGCGNKTGSRMRRLPGPAGCRLSGGDTFSRGSLRVVSGLAENTDSIFCDGHQRPEAANGCPVLQNAGTISREAY